MSILLTNREPLYWVTSEDQGVPSRRIRAPKVITSSSSDTNSDTEYMMEPTVSRKRPGRPPNKTKVKCETSSVSYAGDHGPLPLNPENRLF